MNPLHLAISEKNTEQIEWLLEHGEAEQLLIADEEGMTPLMLAACRYSDEQHIQKMLEQGADLQARNRQGQTALLQALDHNNLWAVQTLLEWYDRHAIPIAEAASTEQGHLALLLAVYQEDLPAIEALLQAGVEREGRHRWERTPLMLAAEAGRKQALGLLLERGARVDSVDEHGKTALSLAARGHQAACVRLLLDYGANPNHSALNGWTPLLEAALGTEGTETARLLLAHGADVHARAEDWLSALSLAGFTADEEMLRTLLEAGAAQDARNLQEAYCIAYRHDWADTAPLLRQAGATEGLFEAIAQLDLQKVSHWILEEKVDVNIRTHRGRTPLLAAVSEGCRFDSKEAGMQIIRLLLEQGADVNAICGAGSTALGTALYFHKPEIANLLLEYGAELEQRDRVWEEIPLTIEPVAANLEALREMLKRGANIDARNSREQTALMRAAEHGESAVVAFLLGSGADVDLRDSKGRTALMYATRKGDLESVGLLVIYGASVEVRDNAGITALQIAKGWIGKGIVERLQAVGAEM